MTDPVNSLHIKKMLIIAE